MKELNVKEEMELACRICLKKGIRTDFIAPCSCNGNQKWVHRPCLDEWRSIQDDNAFLNCSECLITYSLTTATNDTAWRRFKNEYRFMYFVIRDLILVLLGMHIVISLFGSICFGIDRCSDGSIINAFKMDKSVFLFYYLVGLFITLVLVGIVSLYLQYYARRMNAVVPDVSATTAVSSQNKVNTSEKKERNGLCHFCGICCEHCCICCQCCAECVSMCPDSRICSVVGAGCPRECGVVFLFFMLYVLVIFVLTCTVWCFVLIADFLSNVAKRHVHMLRKRALVHEYIVQDLAEDVIHMQGSPLLCDHSTIDLERGVVVRLKTVAVGANEDSGLEVRTILPSLFFRNSSVEDGMLQSDLQSDYKNSEIAVATTDLCIIQP